MYEKIRNFGVYLKVLYSISHLVFQIFYYRSGRQIPAIARILPRYRTNPFVWYLSLINRANNSIKSCKAGLGSQKKIFFGCSTKNSLLKEALRGYCCF